MCLKPDAVCVHVSVGVGEWVCVCPCMCVKKPEDVECTFITFHPIPLRQGLSVNLQWAILARLAGHQSSRIPFLHSPVLKL